MVAGLAYWLSVIHIMRDLGEWYVSTLCQARYGDMCNMRTCMGYIETDGRPRISFPGMVCLGHDRTTPGISVQLRRGNGLAEWEVQERRNESGQPTQMVSTLSSVNDWPDMLSPHPRQRGLLPLGRSSLSRGRGGASSCGKRRPRRRSGRVSGGLAFAPLKLLSLGTCLSPWPPESGLAGVGLVRRNQRLRLRTAWGMHLEGRQVVSGLRHSADGVPRGEMGAEPPSAAGPQCQVPRLVDWGNLVHAPAGTYTWRTAEWTITQCSLDGRDGALLPPQQRCVRRPRIDQRPTTAPSPNGDSCSLPRRSPQPAGALTRLTLDAEKWRIGTTGPVRVVCSPRRRRLAVSQSPQSRTRRAARCSREDLGTV